MILNEQDNMLIKRAKNGDVEAYEDLVRAYYKTVFNIALRMFSNNEDASDITQEVFIKIYKSIGTFEGKSSLKTWIYRITTNLCLDEFRSRKNMKVVSFDEQIEQSNDRYNIEFKTESITPESNLLKKEVKEALNIAITELPKDLRIALILRDVQNLSYEEISSFLKCPQGTVKSRISRARQLLRKKLSKKVELFDMHYVKSNREEKLT
ncbi:MAG: sigma-70 family RNA polymerase sigma factor [Clostridia bacterium]